MGGGGYTCWSFLRTSKSTPRFRSRTSCRGRSASIAASRACLASEPAAMANFSRRRHLRDLHAFKRLSKGCGGGENGGATGGGYDGTTGAQGAGGAYEWTRNFPKT